MSKTPTTFGPWLRYSYGSFRPISSPYDWLCHDELAKYFAIPDPRFGINMGLRVRVVLTLNRPRWNAIELKVPYAVGTFALEVRKKMPPAYAVPCYKTTGVYPRFWRFVARYCKDNGVQGCWMGLEYVNDREKWK